MVSVPFKDRKSNHPSQSKFAFIQILPLQNCEISHPTAGISRLIPQKSPLHGAS